MPLLSFNFSGWVRADIKTVIDAETCKEVDVSNMPAEELAEKLKKSEYLVMFADAYENSDESENEITDFKAED